MTDTHDIGDAPPPLSIVIPALNAATGLPACLKALSNWGEPVEIIVVDGGSADDTTIIAEKAGAHVISSPKGRGLQLKTGADAAQGDWLLFLHADTVLSEDWAMGCRSFMDDTDNSTRAAAFQFALDDTSPHARRVERMVAWRCAKLGLPYGDQGLLISRATYHAVGGFKALPLMEDVDLVRRIGRDRIHMLDATATTSAARYLRNGWWARPAQNLFCLFLYICGVPPRWIAKLYE